jgi:hypothetical protein
MSASNGSAPRRVAIRPRRGDEAVWEFDVDAVRPMPNFGSRPTSAPYRDPDRWSRVRDVLVAGVIFLVLLSSASLYVSGVLAHEEAKSAPAQTRDPFAIVGGGGNR